MIRGPSRSRSADDSALTVACVPTGMNTGVSMSPCAVVSTPARARPARATTRNVPCRRAHEAVRCCSDQHRVAVAVEPVAERDRLAVGGQHRLPLGERRHQHQQRRARQVKVGDQIGHHEEALAGQQIQIGLAFAGRDVAARRRAPPLPACAPPWCRPRPPRARPRARARWPPRSPPGSGSARGPGGGRAGPTSPRGETSPARRPA